MAAGRNVVFALASALALQCFTAVVAPRAAIAAEESFTPRVPTGPEHAEYVVEVNAKGQVARVRSSRSSRDAAFNTMTYGNALQAFIRTIDGKAVSGIYRLAYDYAPNTKHVRRTVSLLRVGGVNPNSPGAVDQMTADARSAAAAAAGPSPKPLPDFESIEKSH